MMLAGWGRAVRGSFLRQLPARPLHPLPPRCCCGASPFRPTPILLKDDLEFWFPKSRKGKLKAAKEKAKAAREAFPVDDGLPTVVEWDALTGPSEKPKGPKGPKKGSKKYQLLTKKEAMAIPGSGTNDFIPIESVEEWQRKKGLKSEEKLQRKITKRMELLAEINRTAELAKQAIIAAQKADESVSVSDRERLVQDAEKAVKDNAALVSKYLATKPETVRYEACDMESLHSDAEQAKERSATLSRDLYYMTVPPAEDIKVDGLRVRARDPLLPRHPAVTVDEWKPAALGGTARRRVQLYERERFNIQKRLKVTPGSDERRDEVEAALVAWTSKRMAQEARLAWRRETKLERAHKRSRAKNPHKFEEWDAVITAKKEAKAKKKEEEAKKKEEKAREKEEAEKLRKFKEENLFLTAKEEEERFLRMVKEAEEARTRERGYKLLLVGQPSKPSQ